MRRIRTIKPELPESESIGRLSRDARLVFILLFTQADDEGRLRGVPKLIASQIFPYDEDAAGFMEGWLTEIEREGLIVRYVFGGANFIFITGWKKHQKIDKPSASKFPAPDDRSARSRRDFAECSPKPREPSATDQDLDQDLDRELEQDSGASHLTSAGAAAGMSVGQEDHSAEASPGRPSEIPTMEDDAKKSRRRKTVDSADFETFYAAYPVPSDKGLARIEFAKACKKAPFSVIMAGLSSYSWPAERWIKKPGNWLKAECWADEARGDPALRVAGLDADGELLVPDDFPEFLQLKGTAL